MSRAWEVIGRSVEGRPIVARCWRGGGEPAVLLFGAIHGDEPLGVHCLDQLADDLDTRTGTSASTDPRPVASTSRDVWIVPIANPDGLARRRKNNARDVDLNRNFPAANWTRDHQPGYDPGPAPGSEPETQALMALIARTGARRLIALHSPFRTVNYDGPARELAERMAAANGYGASGDIGYPTPGSFGSTYGVDLGCEVITLEIPPMSPEQAWAENRTALLVTLE